MLVCNEIRSSLNFLNSLVNERRIFHASSRQLQREDEQKVIHMTENNSSILSQHCEINSFREQCSKCTLFHLLNLEKNQMQSPTIPHVFVKETIDAFTSCLLTFGRWMRLQMNVLSKTILVLLILFYLPITSHSKKYWGNQCFSETESNINKIPWCIAPTNDSSLDVMIAEKAAERLQSFKEVMNKFHPETYTIHDNSIQDCCVSTYLHFYSSAKRGVL